jgi:hypothetical protein
MLLLHLLQEFSTRNQRGSTVMQMLTRFQREAIQQLWKLELRGKFYSNELKSYVGTY